MYTQTENYKLVFYLTQNRKQNLGAFERPCNLFPRTFLPNKTTESEVDYNVSRKT